MKAWEQSARHYDLLYSWKDYAAEAARIRSIIRRHMRSSGNDLLEVACGTGGHARYLKKHFRIVAIDINPGMLRVARRNVKGVEFRQADMRTFNLGRQFDVVLCLFSSIGYMKTTAQLKAALGKFARHLKLGGVAIIEPWFEKSKYGIGVVHLSTCEDGKTKIARLSVSGARGKTSLLDMHHLVAEQGKQVKYFVEHHELGMFERGEILRLMRESGFRARWQKSGFRYDRGLFIGIKQ